MGDPTRKKPAPRSYWCKEPGEELIGHLRARNEDYWRILEDCGAVDAAYRNWRLYHSLHYDSVGGQIVPGGEEGDIDQVAVNEFRGTLGLLLSYALSVQLDWDAQAQDSTQETLEATKFANDLMDFLEDAPAFGVSKKRAKAAEECMIFRVGYVSTCWDENAGKPIGVLDKKKKLYKYAGALRLGNPSLLDVFTDPMVLEHDDRKWICWRERVNRYEEAETYYDKRDEILDCPSSFDDAGSMDRFHGMDWGLVRPQITPDLIDKWTFLHLPTRAMPKGRMFCYAGETELKDTTCPPWYRRLPIHPIVYAPMLGTALFGHSPGADIGPLQDALNRVVSAVVTNQRKFGQQKLWMQDGMPVSLAELEPGADVIRCNVEPKALNLLQSAPELMQSPGMLTSMMGHVLNVAEASRGNVERETSGIAMAFSDSKTLQANSRFDAAYKDLSASVGTSILHIMQETLTDPVQIPIVSEGEVRGMQAFTGERLKRVDRILIKQGTAALRTSGERLHLAELLVQMPGLLSNPREIITVMQTGNLDNLTKAEDAQRRLIADENLRLKAGEIFDCAPSDDHIGHLKGHGADFASMQAREDTPAGRAYVAHSMTHLQRLVQDPIAQGLMLAQGWATPDQLAAFSAIALPQMGAPPGQPGMSPEAAPPGVEGAPPGPKLLEAPAGEPPGLAPQAQKSLEEAKQHLNTQAAQPAMAGGFS